MKKIKKILLTLSLIIVGVLTLFQQNSVEAATSNVIFSYKTYDGNLYDSVQTDEGKNNAFKAAYPSYTFEWTKLAADVQAASGYGEDAVGLWGFMYAKKYEYIEWETAQSLAAWSPLPGEKTTFLPGERITVEVNAKFSANYLSAAIVVPIDEIYDPTFATSDKKYNDHQNSTAYIDGSRIKLGFSYNIAVESDSCTIGAISFTLQNGLNGSYSLDKPSSSAIGDVSYCSYKTVSDAGQIDFKGSPSNFTFVSKDINVAGKSSETNFTSLNIGTTDIIGAGVSPVPGMVNEIEVMYFKPTAVQLSGIKPNSTFNVNGVVASSGKIASVSFAKTESDALSQTNKATSTSTGYNVSTSGYESGSVIYLRIDVLASDGETSQIYMVQFTIDKDNSTSLDAIKITYGGQEKELKLTGTTYKASSKWSYSTNISYEITITPNNKYQSLQAGLGTDALSNLSPNVDGKCGKTYDFTPSTSGNTLTSVIRVKAQDGTQKDYTVVFEIDAADSNCDLEGLVITNADGTSGALYDKANLTATDFSSGTTEYTFRISSDVKNISLTPTFGTLKSCSIRLNSSTAQPATSGYLINITASGSGFQDTDYIYITVTAQSGITKEYKIKINIISADTSLESDPKFKDPNDKDLTVSYEPGSKTYTVTGLDYKYNQFQISQAIKSGQKITLSVGGASYTIPNGTYTNISFDGKATAVETITYTMLVTSAAGTTQEYKVNVTRNGPSDDKSITSVSVEYAGTTKTGIIRDNTISLPEAFEYSTIRDYTVKVLLKDGTIQTVAIGLSSSPSGYTSGTYSGTFPAVVTPLSVDVYIKVTAQDKSTKEYILTITRAAADTDNALENLSLTDSDGAEVGEWNLGDQTYTVSSSLPFSITKVKATATLPGGSKATVSINGSGKSEHTLSYSGFGKETIKFEIVVRAENGTERKIEISVERDGANDDATFEILATNVDGTSIEMNTAGNVTSTKTNLPFETSSVKFVITPKASTTKVYIGADEYTGSEYIYTYPSSTASIINGDTTITFVTQANSRYAHTIRFIRDGANNDATFEIEAKDSAGTLIDMTQEGSSNIMKNTSILSFETNSVSFKITPNNPGTKVIINGTNYTGTTYIYTYPSSIAPKYNGDTTIEIVTQAADISGTSVTWTIRFVRDAAENDKELQEPHTLTDIAGNDYTPTVESNRYKYSIPQADATDSKFYITASTHSTKAKIYTTTNMSNVGNLGLMNEFHSGNSFVIGTDLYLVVYSEYGLIAPAPTYYKIFIIQTEYTDTRSTDHSVIDIVPTAGEMHFVQSTTTYTINVGYKTSSIAFNVKLNDSKASLRTNVSSLDSALNGKATYNDKTGALTTSLLVGTNFIYIQSQAENETYVGTVYVITVNRADAAKDDFIENVKINSIDLATVNDGINYEAFDKYGSALDIALGRGVSRAVLAFTISPYASYDIQFNGASIANGKNTIASFDVRIELAQGVNNTVTVIIKSEKMDAEGGAGNVYTFNIYRVDQTFDVSNIEILSKDKTSSLLDVDKKEFSFESGTKDQPTFIVPFATASAYLDVTLALTTKNALIKGDGSKDLIANADTTWTITVMSEYASLNPNIKDQSITYTIKIHRNEASTEDTLSSLSVMIDGTEYIVGFNPTNYGPYRIENIPSSTTLATITADPKSSLATVTGTGNITLDLISSNSRTITVSVTSESGSTKKYEIIISTKVIVLDGNNEISSITGTDVDNNSYIGYLAATKNYTVKLPATYSAITLVATPSVASSKLYFSIDDASEQQVNTVSVPVAAGGTKKVVIYCKAQDGTAGDNYTITINRDALNNDATLSSLALNKTAVEGFAANKLSYTVHVENSVTTAVLEFTTTASTTKITNNDAPVDSPYSLQIGNNTLQITAQAQDLSTKTYIITVVRDDLDTLSDIDVIIAAGENKGNSILNFNNSDSYDLSELPYDANKLDISAITSGDLANLDVNIKVNGIEVANSGKATIDLAEGANKIVIAVETESGAIKEYTINVTRKNGSTDNFIESYVDETGKTLATNKTDTTYTYVVDRSYVSFNPTIEVSSNATLKLPDTKVLNVGRNTFNVTVTSETGVDRNYTFIVYKNESSFDIDDIEVLVAQDGADLVGINGTGTVEYIRETYVYSLTVSHSVKNFFLNIVKDGLYSTIYVNGKVYSTPSLQSLKDGTNTFTIYAVSEYGMANSSAVSSQTSPTYTITITREAANGDASLSDLKIMSGDTDLLLGSNASPKFDPDTLSYTIQNVGDITTINIIATKNHESATIVSGTGVQTLEQLSDATGHIKGYVFSYSVKVRAEDGTEREYKINISRGPIDLDKDNVIGYVVVKDSNGKVYLGQSNFNSTTLSYEYDLPFSVQSYNIEIVKATSVSPAVSFGTGQFTVNSSDYGTQKTHKVYLTSESGVKGTEYEIVINISEPSSDNKLNDIKINGVSISDFDPDITSYNLGTYPNATDKLDVTFIQSDSKSSVTVNNPSPLKVGQNTISIAVTAEDGTTKIYNMTVLRDYPLPYLTNLEGVGEQLLDESDKATTFDRDTYTYHFVVTFLVLQMNFNASVDNTSHSVVCSNATYKTDQSTGNTRVFNAILNEGINTFTFVVTSIEGKAQTYTVVVQRRGASSTNTNIDINHPINIENIPDFADDFSNLVTSYGPYQVPYSVTSAGNISLVLENGAASYEVFNETLAVGNNRVIILITAEDKITTRAIVVNVERADVEIEIDEEAYEEFKPEATEKENVFTIDLGDKRASAITDYKKFLNMSDADKAASTIEVLSDTSREDCSEVVIRVTDVNGSTSQTYTFQLASTSINTGSQGISWYVWLVLGIVVILLIIILICVNRDKYGSILKKRKRANS